MMEANDETQSDSKLMMEAGDNGSAGMSSKNGESSSGGLGGGGGGSASSNDMSGNQGKFSKPALSKIGFFDRFFAFRQHLPRFHAQRMHARQKVQVYPSRDKRVQCCRSVITRLHCLLPRLSESKRLFKTTTLSIYSLPKG